MDENFTDSLGETLGPFILKNETHFAAVLEKIERAKYIDARPLWKILKEQQKCDVLSILEKEVNHTFDNTQFVNYNQIEPFLQIFY